MRKGFFAAFVAALSIFAAVPSYAKMEGCYSNPLVDFAGWYYDGAGWKHRLPSIANLFDFKSVDDLDWVDTYGWSLINGRYYHMNEDTRYCDLDTTVDGFTVDKTGALTENGVVVDLGHKDGEFTFATGDFERTSDGKIIFNRNKAYEIEKKALELGIKPTGEKLYYGGLDEVPSEDNYCGWMVEGPGIEPDTATIRFYDCTAKTEVCLGQMRKHPERTYMLKLHAADAEASNQMRWLPVLWDIIPPTSYLVPAGYLPTP